MRNQLQRPSSASRKGARFGNGDEPMATGVQRCRGPTWLLKLGSWLETDFPTEHLFVLCIPFDTMSGDVKALTDDMPKDFKPNGNQRYSNSNMLLHP